MNPEDVKELFSQADVHWYISESEYWTNILSLAVVHNTKLNKSLKVRFLQVNMRMNKIRSERYEHEDVLKNIYEQFITAQEKLQVAVEVYMRAQED
jgi:hypothetical protein